jgi:hypothetical protein
MGTGPVSDEANGFTGQYPVAPAGESLTTNFNNATFQFRGYARAIKNASAASITVTVVLKNDAAVTGTNAPGTSGVAYVLPANGILFEDVVQVLAGSWTLGQIVALC